MEEKLEIPGAAARWYPHEIVEAATGSELTLAAAEQIRDWPEEKRADLAERLAASVVGCLKLDPDPISTSLDVDSFGAVDRMWRAEGGMFEHPIQEIRQQLLYLPRVYVIDHFSRFIVEREPDGAIADWELIPETETDFRKVRLFDVWLESLCTLAPALRSSAVQLVIPYASEVFQDFQSSSNSTDLSIRDTLRRACFAFAEDLEVASRPLNVFQLVTEGAFHNVQVSNPSALLREVVSLLETKSDNEIWEAVAISDWTARNQAKACQSKDQPIQWQSLTSMTMRALYRATQSLTTTSMASNLALGVNSIVGGHSVVPCMKLFGLQTAEDLMSTKKREVAQTLSRFRLPSAGKVSMNDLLAMRQSEKIFTNVQRAVGDVVKQVAAFNPKSQLQFELELEQAMDDLLTPKIEALQKTSKSSFLEKSIIPGGLTMGAGAVVLAVTHTFPPTAIAGAALAPASYLADSLYKRYRSSGRNDRRVVEALLTFQEMGRR